MVEQDWNFPVTQRAGFWSPVLNTAAAIKEGEIFAAGAKQKAPARSVLVFAEVFD
jgi:hypothetical protein